MGLLEKALRFKKNINDNGEKTLIDKIPGPADTQFEDGASDNEEIVFLKPTELEPIEVFKDYKPKDESTVSPDEDIGEEQKKNSNEDETIQDETGADETVDNNEQEYKKEDLELLSEVGNDILIAGNEHELFDAMSFAIMGQIGVSSATVILPTKDNSEIWEVGLASGVELADQDFSIDTGNEILRQLIMNQQIIDIEDFKNKKEYKKDYYTFISIDAHLLVPIIYDDTILGAVILGDKLEEEIYTDEDRRLLKAITGYAAIALQKLRGGHETGISISDSDISVNVIKEVDRIQELIISEANLEKVESILQQEFAALGIESYALFIKNENNDRFIPIIVEKEDYLQLKEGKFAIKLNSNFIQHLNNSENHILVEDYYRSGPILETFSDKMIKKMKMARIYPYKIGGNTLGFAMIFKMKELDKLHDVDLKLKRLSGIIFEYIKSIMYLDHNKNKYIDNVEHIFSKIEVEITRAKKVNIPLTLVLFSIKNYKRYFHLYGYEDVKKLLDNFEVIIRKRLSDEDFSVRYDKNKIMIILPGKDKKYALPLSNAIKNEVVNAYLKEDKDLLLTFIVAEFPKDGNNIYTLMETLE